MPTVGHSLGMLVVSNEQQQQKEGQEKTKKTKRPLSSSHWAFGSVKELATPLIPDEEQQKEEKEDRKQKRTKCVFWCWAMCGFAVWCVPMAIGVYDIIVVAIVHPTEGVIEELNSSVVHYNASQCVANPHPVVPLFGSHCPEFSHYCADSEAVIHWTPLPKCVLPPPQPFWLEASGTSIKGVGMGIVFWTTLADPEPKCTNCWGPKTMEKAIIAFTVGSTFVSIFLLTIKAWSMDFETYWEHFQCAGVIFSLAPWSANFMLYMGKCFAAESLKDATGGRRGVEKANAYQVIGLSTLGAFVLLDGAFAITNLLPGALAYLWLSVPVIALLLVARMKMREALRETDEHGQIRKNDRGDFIPNEYAKSERGINISPLTYIPLAIVLDVLVQWLATTSIYLYQGMGYWQAAWTSTSERQSSIYFNTMTQQVLKIPVWAAELLNEVMP